MMRVVKNLCIISVLITRSSVFVLVQKRPFLYIFSWWLQRGQGVRFRSSTSRSRDLVVAEQGRASPALSGTYPPPNPSEKRLHIPVSLWMWRERIFGLVTDQLASNNCKHCDVGASECPRIGSRTIKEGWRLLVNFLPSDISYNKKRMQDSFSCNSPALSHSTSLWN